VADISTTQQAVDQEKYNKTYDKVFTSRTKRPGKTVYVCNSNGKLVEKTGVDFCPIPNSYFDVINILQLQAMGILQRQAMGNVKKGAEAPISDPA